MSTLRCPAKVNLYLAILGRDPSGYHEIDTVFVRVPTLADELTIEPAEKLQIEFLPGEGIEPGDNTLSKAVQLLEAHTGRPFNYKIRVTKNIPLQSGLGGGSSDAASLLLYLNDHENLGLSPTELAALGAQVGMDVPFFLSGYEVARGTHYGEKITPLPALPPGLKITIEPGRAISTQEAYARWDVAPELMNSKLQPLLLALQNQDAVALISAVHNDFEYLIPECGLYSKTRHLCGSGGAVFKVLA